MSFVIPSTPMQALKSIKSQLLASPLLLMRLINVGAQFVVSLLTVRLLGLETAGIVFVVQAIWILGRTVGSWGYYWVVLRDRAYGRGGIRSVWLATTQRIVVINVGLGAACVTAKALFPSLDILPWPFLICAWGGFSILGVAALGMAAFLAARSTVRAVSLEMLGLPIVQGLPVVIFGLLWPHAGAIWVVGAQLALLALGAFLLCRPLLLRRPIGATEYRLPRARQAWTLWLSDCGTNVSLRLPLFLTQAFIGPAAGAVVAVVQQLGMIGSIFNWAAITSAHGRLARAVNSGSRTAIQQVMLSGAPLAVTMNLLLIAALLLGGLTVFEHIYGVSGPEFRWGVTILAIMALADGVFGIGISALNFSHRERLSAGLSIVMSLAIVAVTWSLFQTNISPILSATLALSVCWTSRGIVSWVVGITTTGPSDRSVRQA